jgi:predicted DNA-binding protein (UPF0251 family)
MLVIKPVGIPTKDLQKVELNIDELETLHLFDSGGLSQTDAGTLLGVPVVPCNGWSPVDERKSSTLF